MTVAGIVGRYSIDDMNSGRSLKYYSAAGEFKYFAAV
jgi:hypothetical protein